MKALKEVWNETRVLYRGKKSGFLVASFFFINKLIEKMYIHFDVFMFKRKWRMKRNGVKVYDFNGALMPDVKSFSYAALLNQVFDETFLVSCLYGDNYEEKAEFINSIVRDGPYGYKDGTFDVTVKEGDVVFDVGAWAGDFSAYCSQKKASRIYAFEPCADTLDILKKTAELNPNIEPVPCGLGEKEEQMSIYVKPGSLGNSVKRVISDYSETIQVKTIDAFVQENGITKLDFIKADIEGAERDMLMGGGKNAQAFRAEAGHLHLPLAG